MAATSALIPAADLTSSATLPRDCTFSPSDWHALAPHWYPVAFSHEVTDKPHAARLLDERVVVYRLSNGAIAAAKDICYHRGAPPSLGHVEGDEIICKYLGLRYNASGQCTCIPAHPNGAISPRLRLHMLRAQEAFGLIWIQLIENHQTALPVMDEWSDPDYIQVLPNSVPM